MKRILITLSQKWPEYLLEILVLIIGIYSAFTLDNWNEERKERIREQDVLKVLLEDYQNDLSQLDTRIELRDLVIKSAQQSLEYIDQPEGVPEDSIYYKVSALFFTTTLDPVDHKLMESGNIQLIQNKELKHLLTKWQSDLYQLKEVEYEYLNTYRNIILPYLIESGLERNIDHAIWNNSAYYQGDFYLEKASKVPNLVQKPKVSLKALDILGDPKLEGILSNAMSINYVCQIESEGIRIRMEKIIGLLQMEINN